MKRYLALLIVLAMLLSLVPSAAAAGFTDVQPGAYYENAVNWAVSKGITTGISATEFAPDMNCTRAQVVTFLWRAMGKPTPNMTEHGFSDVPIGAYYSDAVLWAVEAGVTTGVSVTKFAPDMTCTRAQVVTFLWRAMGCPAPTMTTHNFADVIASSYYEKAVLWAVEHNITTGVSATKFAPDMICTRAQVVTFLHRTLQGDGPLQIVTHPQSVTCSFGQQVQLQVVATGGVAPYRYQWEYQIGSNDSFHVLAGETFSTLDLQANWDYFDQNWKFRCVVTDLAGERVVSNAACLIENTDVRLQQPLDFFCTVGDWASFTTGAWGDTGPYSYQWQYSVNNGEFTDLNIVNAGYGSDAWAYDWNTASLHIFVADDGEFEDNVRYRCVITDKNGNHIITAAARSYLTYPAGDGRLTIVDEPSSVPCKNGDMVSFDVSVTGGTPPYTYQWQVADCEYPEFVDLDGTEGWANGYHSDELSFIATTTDFTYQMRYRCMIRDANGGFVYTNVVYPFAK